MEYWLKKIAATNIFHIFNKKNFRLHDYRNEQQSQKGLRVFSSDVFMGYATRTIKKKNREKERKKEGKQKNDNEITDESDVIR